MDIQDSELDPIETLDGEPVGGVSREMVQPKEPWERQPEETPSAWKAFQVYRDIGVERSIAAAARVLKGSETKKTTNQTQYNKYHKWSKKYNWELRALAYDKMIDRQKVDQAIADAKKMTERHIGIAVMMQAKGVKRIREMTEDQIARMKLPEAIKMIDQGVEIERLARGLSTTNVRSEVSGKVQHEADERVLDAVNNAREVLAGKLDEIERKKAQATHLMKGPLPTRSDAEEKNGSAEVIRKELLPHLQKLDDLRAN